MAHHKDILEILDYIFPHIDEIYTRRMNTKVNNWKTIPLAQLREKLLEEFSEYNLAVLHNESEDRRFKEALDNLLVALFVAFREKECVTEDD